MASLLWFGFFIFTSFVSVYCLSSELEETCYKFAKTNVGSISPNHFDKSIAAGSSLELRCSLDAKFVRERSLTSRDITWQRDTVDIRPDSRISITPTDEEHTSVIKVRDVTFNDSGSYRCMVELAPINVTSHKQFICSVTARVAAPPRKYVSFTCGSYLMEDLKCTWKRPDASPVNYTLKYRFSFENEDQTRNCPEPFSPGRKNGGPVKDTYGCMIRFRTKEEHDAEVKKNNGSVIPPFLSQYLHIITITASNELYDESWNEAINPRDYAGFGSPQFELPNISSIDARTCRLVWTMSVHTFPDDKGIKFEIDCKKNDSDAEVPWTRVEKAYSMGPQTPDVDGHIYKKGKFVFDVDTLYAFANYTFRVRGFPYGALNGTWGNYSFTNCSTPSAAPSGKPGVIEGAYEEQGEGLQRTVDLYWKGVPKDFQNGPMFRYKVEVFSTHGSYSGIDGVNYNHILVKAPYNETTTVNITPMNSLSDPKYSKWTESVTILPVRSKPLRIIHTNVEILRNSVYEVYWETNERADGFTIFSCPTSLDPYISRCATEMTATDVPDSTARTFVLKLDQKKPHHRVAVAAYRRNSDGSTDHSGMQWVRYQCREEDAKIGLDGLMTYPDINASVTVDWVVPCHRFMKIERFRINYAPCPAENRTACVQNMTVDVPYNSSKVGPACLRSTVIHSLQPDTRYCFSLSILTTSAETSTAYSVSQCMMTGPLPTPIPIVMIVVGSVASAVALVIICLVLWRAFKRLRKDFRDIKKESQKIVLPTKPALSGDYNGTHYTMVEGDDTGRYLRQQSEGIGSMGGEDMGKVTPLADLKDETVPFVSFLPGRIFPELVTEGLKPLKTRRATDSTSLVARLSQSLLNLENAVSTKRSGSVPGVAHLAVSRESLVAERRPSGSSERITVVLPRSGSVATELTGLNSLGCSGVESNAPASSGYVAAEGFSQANQSAASSSEQTGDTGYVSQPVSNYDSSASSTVRRDVLAGTMSGSSGFSEASNSPDHPSEERHGNVWEKTSTELSSRKKESFQEGRGASSPLLQKNVTTTQLSGSNRISKAPVAQPVANGYVAWP